MLEYSFFTIIHNIHDNCSFLMISSTLYKPKDDIKVTKLVIGENDLKTVNHLLADEWHETKNGELSPTMFTAGSSKKVWWRGACGHEWEATIASRNKGAGCKICARKELAEKIRKASVLKNGSLIESNPTLAKEWNDTKNGSLKPDSISANSHDTVWWICSKGHEWPASIHARNKGDGCPYCSGKKVVAGKNDLQTINPDLAREWDYEKNTLRPNQVSYGSNKSVWWKCANGHEWPDTIKGRSNGRNCPFCAGLTFRYPEIAKEWLYERNSGLSPDTITPGSHTKVWWKCSKGHEWPASPNHRISKGRNCPFCCHNPKVNPGENDLEKCYPDLAKEWNYLQNGKLTPKDVTAKSSRKVWWVCKKGHEWKIAINHRANGSGCPFCSSGMQTSFPEQAIYYYVLLACPDAENGYTGLFNNHGMELDIYIPSLKIGIEYDGAAFHRTKKQQERELKKYRICKENNVFLIRIRENTNYTSMDSSDVLLLVEKDINDVIKKLANYIIDLENIDYDVDRDKEIIQSRYMTVIERKSLAFVNPELAKEWNYDKNTLGPELYTAGSNDKVWWKCEKGHEWPASIDSRNNRGTRCPYCSNRKVLAGFNDLKYLRPDLMEEWHPTKNTNLDPSTLRPGSGNHAWWKCSKCGYEWEAEISSRNKGHGCRECAINRRKKKS